VIGFVQISPAAPAPVFPATPQVRVKTRARRSAPLYMFAISAHQLADRRLPLPASAGRSTS
jgi:hypothetical protein